MRLMVVLIVVVIVLTKPGLAANAQTPSPGPHNLCFEASGQPCPPPSPLVNPLNYPKEMRLGLTEIHDSEYGGGPILLNQMTPTFIQWAINNTNDILLDAAATAATQCGLISQDDFRVIQAGTSGNMNSNLPVQQDEGTAETYAMNIHAAIMIRFGSSQDGCNEMAQNAGILTELHSFAGASRMAGNY